MTPPEEPKLTMDDPILAELCEEWVLLDNRIPWEEVNRMAPFWKQARVSVYSMMDRIHSVQRGGMFG